MSVRVMSWVFESAPLKNDATGMLLLLAIADHCADDGTGAYPSITRLCRKTRMSTRTVQRALARLEEEGMLTVDRSKGPHGTHVFKVNATPVTVTPCQPDAPVSLTPEGVSGCRDRGVTVTSDPSENRQKNRQSAAAGAAAPTQALLAYFDRRYTERFGTKATFTPGKDAKHMADLWRQRRGQAVTVELLIDTFFASRDSWIAQSGFTVGVFFSQAARLTTEVASKNAATSYDASAAQRTREMLAQKRQAVHP